MAILAAGKDATLGAALAARADADREADGEAAESAMVGALLSRVGVDPVQNSRLVDVTFVSAEPAFAARAINAL